jgi:ABC-2 type transport system permease protein
MIAMITFFLGHGHRTALQQWSFQWMRALLYLSIVALWAYVWSMAGEDVWNRLHLSWALLVWYIVIAETVAFLGTNPQRTIESDWREGRFQTHLSRPQSWLVMLGLREVGYLPFNLLLVGGLGFGFAMLATGTVPFGIIQAVEILVHIALAAIIWMQMMLCVGLTTLWMGSMNLAYWLVQKAGFILGGLLLPIALYPEWLQSLAYATPFAAVFYLPAQSILPQARFGFIDGVAYQLMMMGVTTSILWLFSHAFEQKMIKDG